MESQQSQTMEPAKEQEEAPGLQEPGLPEFGVRDTQVGDNPGRQELSPLKLDWTYAGHGEWIKMVENTQVGPKFDIQYENHDAIKWLRKLGKDIQLHYKVMEGGYPNRYGARIPVESQWKLDKMEQLLEGYKDKEVVEWLRYGWPTGRLPGLADPQLASKNHKGAQDLSFPIGYGVNDGIPKDSYLGFEAKLTFPKTDDFAFRIYQLGPNCLMFKVDLSRYFRQLPLDPGDYSLIGYIVQGNIYFDKVLPMGMRSVPYIAQRITDVISYIHRQMGLYLLNYVDDFVSAELRDKIWKGYQYLTRLLEELGVDTSKEKLVEPTTRMEFLGITFDTQRMTMEILTQKVQEIIQELDSWLYETAVNRREIESLIGKLQFAAKCVRMGRTFIARLINWLRGLDRDNKHPIPWKQGKISPGGEGSYKTTMTYPYYG